MTETGVEYFCYNCQLSRPSLKRLKSHIKKCYKLKDKGSDSLEADISNIPELPRQPSPEIDLPILHSVFSTAKAGPVRGRRAASRKKKKIHKKFYSCLECDYSTPYAGNLKTHLVRHSNERPLTCEICGHSTLHSASLRRHIMFKHTREKPYACPFCEYRAVQEERVRLHIMAIHTSEKPNVCPYCGHKTVQKGNLRRHIMTVHKKLKPFKCSYCEFTSNDSRRVRDHIVSIHLKEKPFPCPHCDYCATRRGTLKRHMRSKHRNEVQPSQNSSIISEDGSVKVENSPIEQHFPTKIEQDSVIKTEPPSEIKTEPHSSTTIEEKCQDQQSPLEILHSSKITMQNSPITTNNLSECLRNLLQS